MEKILHDISLHFESLILVFVRVSALIFSSPVFGRKALPNAIKIGFSVLIAYIVYTAYPAGPVEYAGVWHYALLVLYELAFGLILGFVTTLFFSIVQTAGHMIDMQIGFGMVNILDVQSNISVPMTGNFLNIVLLVAFFSTGGHRQLIGILVATFRSVPAGAATISPSVGLVALEVFALAFVMALNVAIPLIASGLLGELIMGVLVKSVPQMNIFVVGIPLKILIGFVMLLVVLPVYVRYTNVIFSEMFGAIERMFAGMGAA
jgi:flagellar biosynthetic protein FliR